MSGDAAAINYFSAQEQSEAAQKAADTAAKAQRYGIDVMRLMWEQAQQDFRPFLDVGPQGLDMLTTNMPQYIENNMVPMAQQLAGYQASAPVSPYYGTVNPVTGEISQGPTQMQMNGGAPQLAQNAISVYGGQNQPAVNNYVGAGGTPAITPQQRAPMAPGATPSISGGAALPQQPIGATTNQLAQGGVLAPTRPDLPGAMSQNAIASRPDVPTLPGTLDFQWNPNDQIYQYKLGQAQDATKNYLAAIGMENSSPALAAIRDNSLAVAAEDIDKQYARQLAERDYAAQAAKDIYGMGAERSDVLFNRGQTERNYEAQRLADTYGMDVDRANTLYGRQYQAGQDARNNLTNALAQYDQNQLNQLMRGYDVYGDVYNRLYAGGLDLAKIAAGQAGAAGASSMQAGSDIANRYADIGNTQANAGLAQANIWGNFAQGLSNQSAQTQNQLMNYFNNRNQGTGYSGYSSQPYGSNQYGSYGNPSMVSSGWTSAEGEYFTP